MRILLAVDGSVSSDRATELVSTFALPSDSLIRVVSAQQPYVDVLSLAWATTGEGGRELETMSRRTPGIAGRPSNVPSRCSSGRAPGSRASCCADGRQARSWTRPSAWRPTWSCSAAGATARSPRCSSAAPRRRWSITRHARSWSRDGSSIGTIAFADDGSAEARNAESILARWPIFAGRRVSVVTVAEVAVPVAAGFTPGLYDQVFESYTRSVDEARAEVRERSGRRGGAGSPRRA